MTATSHEDFSRTHEVKASSNRVFGWVFTAVFLIIGLWPLLSGRRAALVVADRRRAVHAGHGRGASAACLPNRLWLRFGLLLNRIISPVVLAFLFYVVVTPMGMLMRAFGKDSLRLRRADADASYWIKRDPPGPKPDSFHHQF